HAARRDGRTTELGLRSGATITADPARRTAGSDDAAPPDSGKLAAIVIKATAAGDSLGMFRGAPLGQRSFAEPTNTWLTDPPKAREVEPCGEKVARIPRCTFCTASAGSRSVSCDEPSRAVVRPAVG